MNVVIAFILGIAVGVIAYVFISAGCVKKIVNDTKDKV
jgi:capsular polysaccharide biosynthesis protein